MSRRTLFGSGIKHHKYPTPLSGKRRLTVRDDTIDSQVQHVFNNVQPVHRPRFDVKTKSVGLDNHRLGSERDVSCHGRVHRTRGRSGSRGQYMGTNMMSGLSNLLVNGGTRELVQTKTCKPWCRPVVMVGGSFAMKRERESVNRRYRSEVDVLVDQGRSHKVWVYLLKRGQGRSVHRRGGDVYPSTFMSTSDRQSKL